MDLFKRKNKELPPLFTEAELQSDTVNYNSVLEYLVGLSEDDYAKVCQVAGICRKADQDACKALGIENEPTSFIHPPEPEPEAEEEPGFLEDLINDKETTAKAKKSTSKQIKVKD